MSAEQWPSVSRGNQRCLRFCKGSVWADQNALSLPPHSMPGENSLVQDSDALSLQSRLPLPPPPALSPPADSDALPRQSRLPLPPPPGFPPPAPYEDTTRVDPWNVQTEDDFDVGETVFSSVIGFERHEESSRTMPSQANVSLREMIRSFQMPQEDENDVVVADSEFASEREPEPEGDEMCSGTLHAEIRGTQKVLCPKSCQHGGQGNTRRKKDYAWRIGEENGEKCLMREEIFPGDASKTQRRGASQYSQLGRSVERIVLETAAEPYHPCGLHITGNDHGSGTNQSDFAISTSIHVPTEIPWPRGFTLPPDNHVLAWADEAVTDLVDDAR